MAEGFSGRLDALARKARPWVPFTALNTVLRMVDKRSESILDVGCGKGEPMKFINRHRKFHTMGVDIFEPYIEACKEQQIHDEYLLCNIQDLPFADKSFDIVLCMEVLEHLEKDDGEKLLKDMERIARRQVILTTPVGFSEQDEFLLSENNPFQVHKSGWQPTELKSLDYKIRGSTISCLAGKAGTIACPNKVTRPLGYLLWLLTSPVAYFFPKTAGDMVCVKRIGC